MAVTALDAGEIMNKAEHVLCALQKFNLARVCVESPINLTVSQVLKH